MYLVATIGGTPAITIEQRKGNRETGFGLIWRKVAPVKIDYKTLNNGLIPKLSFS